MSKTRELPPPPPRRPLFKHHSWSPDMLREEIWRRRQSQKPNHSRGWSLSDDDFDELKACIDLGFGFDSVDVDPKLSDTFPALGLYYAVNKRYANSLSRSSSFSSIVSESDDGNPSTIFDSGEDSQTVKTKLKQWAKIVSCSNCEGEAIAAEGKSEEIEKERSEAELTAVVTAEVKAWLNMVMVILALSSGFRYLSSGSFKEIRATNREGNKGILEFCRCKIYKNFDKRC